MPSLMTKNVDKNLNTFRFLCKIPTLDITSPLQEDNCFVCMEPYRNNGWECDGSLHRPVALPCRHVLGFQCFARWAMSAHFNNGCPLCSMEIIKRPSSYDRNGPFPESPLGRVEAIAVMASGGISSMQKRPLIVFVEKYLRGNAATAIEVPIDQVLVAMEEYLNQMCHASPTAVAAAVVHNHEKVAKQALVMGWAFFIATGFIIDFVDEGVVSFPTIVLWCLASFLCGGIYYMDRREGRPWLTCVTGLKAAVAGVFLAGFLRSLMNRGKNVDVILRA